MTMNVLKYDISDTQYLLLDLPETLNSECCAPCWRTIVSYVDTEKNLNVSFGDTAISDYYSAVIYDSKKLLQNSHVLDPTIIDIGLEYNQMYAEDGRETCLNYALFCNFDQATCKSYYSWLYNDAQGNIVFEITPVYPWFSNSPWREEVQQSFQEMIPYEKWIKDYKSIVKVIIPPERMKTWIIQAEEFSKKYGV